MKIKIVSALLLAAAAHTAQASSVVTDSAASGHTAGIAVMSFNIRFNNPLDTIDTAWEARRESCARLIRLTGPDVVGIQEPREIQKEYLMQMLPEYASHTIAPSDTLPEKHTGHGLLLYRKDRYDLLDRGFFWLSATPCRQSQPWDSTDRHYRVAIWVHLRDRDSGKDFFALTTHFPYKKAPVDTEVRARCAALIVERMKETAGPDATIFITGDMNASPVAGVPDAPGSRSLAPFFDWMKSARDTSVLTDDLSSFNGFGRVAPGTKGKILDHIFYRNARPLVFTTLDKPDFGVRWNSDHFPILTTFTY